MKILKTVAYLTDAELEEKMKSQKQPRAFLDWQIIYSVQTNPGKKAEEFAAFLGVSKHKIYSVIQNYNKYGKTWRNYENWGGRREERCIFSLREESELLKEFEKEAISGNILIYKHIKEHVEAKAGKEVSDDYIWDLFKRHGWKKKVPRQSHPKGDKKEQEEYKKNSKRIWLPSL